MLFLIRWIILRGLGGDERTRCLLDGDGEIGSCDR